MLGLLAGAVTDLRSGRIPNAVTFPLVALGIAIHAVSPVPWAGLAGAAVGFAIHFPLFALGVERGGDAKLLMGVGACLGWRDAVEASAWMAILYLPLGVAILAIRGRLGNLVATAHWVAARAQGVDPGAPPEPTPLRTGPVILVAAGLAWFADPLARWA